VAGRPAWSGPRPVGADGCVGLPDGGRLRVDGLTAPEVARSLANLLGLPPERVVVQIAEYRSQVIYVYGPVSGLEQVVAYRGPETVLDLLQRLGGLTPGAAPGDVRVLRAHVADGKPPEVFHVDLHAILIEHDQQSNVRLLPFDQVHIGRNRRSRLEPCFPVWMRPLYGRACGLRH
jgi:protein involved in polysaccharide export with SLBB domain